MRASPTASLSLEHSLLTQHYRAIVGIDEAGRGAWAGPVTAGAVILPVERADLAVILNGVRDSKQMTAHRRAVLIDVIKATALAWGVGSADAREIDQHGIVPATCAAMARALDDLRARFPHVTPDYLLLDSIRWDAISAYNLPHQALVRGDRLSLSIAAASVLAKVTRDELMREFDRAYPVYGFAAHKGYGVPRHRAAIAEHGACDQHRLSFKPLRV
jgi:ribonuclease HII